MNRRGFIGSIAGFVAACTLDPELALWKPGAKLISVPKPVGVSLLSIAEWEGIEMQRLLQERYFLPAAQAIHQQMLRKYQSDLAFLCGDRWSDGAVARMHRASVVPELAGIFQS